MLTRPHYIASDIYRSSHLGRGHPLSIPRVSVVTDLIRALGWMDPKVYHDAPMATVAVHRDSEDFEAQPEPDPAAEAIG